MNPSTSTESSTASSSVPEQPKRLKLISWNIDGLDTNNIKNRTKGVQRVIANEKPDIVFFQEVIPKSFAYLEGVFDETYECIAGGDTGYFTAALVKKATVKLHDFYLEPFYSSKMGRNLLILQAEVTSSGIPLLLMTSHLESTKEHASERKNQLKKAFEEMKVADSKYTVIFGGDMNTRDSEIVEIGGLPEGISDLYEVTGSRPECKYTWDTNRNDNCIFPGKFKPRCRFDRLYMRPCKSPVRLKPVYFELVGIERLPTCQRFPSDHWGMAVNFDIV
ncbi:PREDICTED: tyrosyl-DNA phosphodiesterase 2-like [Priapulus caudatus]|uniref:Tyrosyl-DNA phosphodiesterase 2-like n=1 Tax=Priapulus caudatus TaxID=37621 RepID=A0ABM1DX47_PRICU|nr:PREDICTED: tyrosyl-DNA phosphodiesterase 2-like [Priapulus caudatus]